MKKKKKYIELLKEIDKNELFEGLIGYGLFPEKIPPFLTSESFLKFVLNTTNNFPTKPSKFIQYDSMRNINIPRILSIPNPISYLNHCKVLRNYWDDILIFFEEKTKTDKYKISRIHIRRIYNSKKIFQNSYESEKYNYESEKYIFEMNHKNVKIDDYPEPKLLIGKKYIVNADISSCYPSIYSHSIAWALVGKLEAKNNIKDKTKYYNKIDETTRNLKDAETNGILIGPHSSNLISEIVLVAIDNVISKKYEYIRNIDDYTCYVETEEKAEKFLIDLSIELKKYNLVLNHKKTKISKLPLASTKHWIRKINTFVFNKERDIKLSEVRAFLDISLELMEENKENSAILNYAIKVLSDKSMTDNAKNYFIDTIHHLVLIYPYLVSFLEKEVFTKFQVDNSDIEEISRNIFKMAKEKKLYEAMSYSIYFGIKYNFKLESNLFDYINSNRDTILMLLSYLHDQKYINHSKVTKKYKNLAKELKKDIDEYWVFVYEVLTVGILKNEWKILKKNSITFIKDDFI